MFLSRLVLSGLSLAVGTNAITFQEAQDDISSISLPMKPCNEEFMKCLQDTTDVTDSAFSISKSDSSTWGTFDSYEDACGSITAAFTKISQLGNPICMMCGHGRYPSIHADCNDADRRLAEDVWTVFDDHQELRRRRAQATPGSDAQGEPQADQRDLQAQTCAYNKEAIVYPNIGDVRYSAAVGPLLLPVNLDLTIPVSDVGGLDESKFKFDNDVSITTPVLQVTNGEYNTRTNQNLVASLMQVGEAISLLERAINAVCDAIPDPLCVGACATNPLTVACFIVQGLIIAMHTVYTFFMLGVNLHDPVIDGAEILGTLRNSETVVSSTCEILSMLACTLPHDINLQRGYGCDGLDNTCDPVKRIDECEEDIFPPEIDINTAMLRCAYKSYATAQDAVDCFQAPGLVSASDDCKEIDLAITDKGTSPVCSGTVVVTATALGCGGRIPEDVTTLEVEVDVDNDAPEVDCFIAAQNLCGSGGNRNLFFSYTAVDNCTATEDLAMSIEVLSNEVVETGDEMVIISTPIANCTNGTVPSIFVKDSVCGTCMISSYPKVTRKYIVLVKATDKAGNVGTAKCSTKIGSEVIDVNDPLFLLTKREFDGGNAVHLPYNITRGCPDGKYYVDYPPDGNVFKCAKDCNPAAGLPCKGTPPDKSGLPTAFFDTVEECCRGKVWWVDEGTCVSDTNGGIPNPPLGSMDWYVNWDIDFGTCAQDCVGPKPCGGLKLNWDPAYKSAVKCCESIPYKVTKGCSL